MPRRVGECVDECARRRNPRPSFVLDARRPAPQKRCPEAGHDPPHDAGPPTTRATLRIDHGRGRTNESRRGRHQTTATVAVAQSMADPRRRHGASHVGPRVASNRGRGPSIHSGVTRANEGVTTHRMCRRPRGPPDGRDPEASACVPSASLHGLADTTSSTAQVADRGLYLLESELNFEKFLA